METRTEGGEEEGKEEWIRKAAADFSALCACIKLFRSVIELMRSFVASFRSSRRWRSADDRFARTFARQSLHLSTRSAEKVYLQSLLNSRQVSHLRSGEQIVLGGALANSTLEVEPPVVALLRGAGPWYFGFGVDVRAERRSDGTSGSASSGDASSHASGVESWPL